MPRPTVRQMQAEVGRFNARFEVGRAIWVAPGGPGGRLEEVTIVEPGAHVLGGHTPVVQVDGGYGCIALTHVRYRNGANVILPWSGR